MPDAAEFSAKIRQNPLARSEAGLERLRVGIKRLLSVLDRNEVAGIRTLEMKISDGGPKPQRVEPHILGLAGVELIERRRVKTHWHKMTGGHSWYAPARVAKHVVDKRLSELVPDYIATTDATFTSALGDPLEISIFKILQRLKQADPRLTYMGSFDLSVRRESGRFRKTEPSVFFNDQQLDGPPDFVLFHPVGEPALIECKNHREWIYPSSDIVKTVVAKALAAEMTPILIARRLPYITKAVLCEPAGIIAHETYNQLYPDTPGGHALAARVTAKRGLGYFDVVASEDPLPRTVSFFEKNLPKLLPRAAQRFRVNRPFLEAWVTGQMLWHELRLRLAADYDGLDHEMDF